MKGGGDARKRNGGVESVGDHFAPDHMIDIKVQTINRGDVHTGDDLFLEILF